MIASTQAIAAQFYLARQQQGKNSFTLDINTELPGKGITAVYGHSGSGKTTFLRCLAGLEQEQQGKVIVGKTCWQNHDFFLPAHQRPIGYVFQDAGLFPHLSVQGNLHYALKRSHKPGNQSLFDEVIALMGIEPLLQHKPQQLSGGEQQRTAIARALLIQPELLLMDEPLSSLDNRKKQEILPYLEQLKDSINIPIIYVSHALDELARLADHILVLKEGQLVQQGSLKEVFADINSADATQQASVVLQGEITSRDQQWHLAKFSFNGGHLQIQDSGEPVGSKLRLQILAKDISLALSEPQGSSIINRLTATITDIQADTQQTAALIRLGVGDELLLAQITHKSVHDLGLKPGMKVWAQIKSAALIR